MTTGWQFATQIEDDEENRFEIQGDSRGPTTQSALLIANRDVFPSMLDPAFEDDPPSPGRAAHDKPDRVLAPLSRGAAEQKAQQQFARLTQALPAGEALSEWYRGTTRARQSSLLEGAKKRPGAAAGIKEFAWRGMPVEADYARLTHHHDSRFVQAD